MKKRLQLIETHKASARQVRLCRANLEVQIVLSLLERQKLSGIGRLEDFPNPYIGGTWVVYDQLY